MAEEAPPPSYESATRTKPSSGITLNTEYPRSIPGLIKITEIVLSLITFICSFIISWRGQGWVEFVALTAFVSSIIYFIFALLNLFNFKTSSSRLWLHIELSYCIIFAVFYLIAMFIATAFAVQYSVNVGVTAFFACLASITFIVDAWIQFREWKTRESQMRTQTTAATTMVDNNPPQY